MSLGGFAVTLILVLLMKGVFSEIVTEPAVELRWDFTTCGSTGQFGPSQVFCDNAYRGTNLEGEIEVKSGIQNWEVPTSGLYLITAWSPSGSSDSARKPGRGASLTGEFRLTKGETLQILVGQHGGIEDEILNNKATGGSGGTFVTVIHKNTDISILLIAGGGSCGSGQNWNTYNTVSDASLFTNANNASIIREDSGLGGMNGNGGNRGDLLLGADSAAGGGAGYISDGSTATLERSLFSEVGNPRPAKSFLSSGFLDKGPGVGGYFMYFDGQLIVESNGGFGGGGSGGRNGGCGGGGGFSGGGGGSMNGWGGGGGSINNGKKQRNHYSSIDVGAVTISFIGHQCCGPVAVYIAATVLAGIFVTVLIGYLIKRIINSFNTNDGESEPNTCGRCWRKLWQIKSKNEPATPKRKT